MSERNTVFLLQDIAEAIQNIFDFTEGLTIETYSADTKTRHAVEHNFMIIREAVSRINEEYKQRHNGINWRQVKDFRKCDCTRLFRNRQQHCLEYHSFIPTRSVATNYFIVPTGKRSIKHFQVTLQFFETFKSSLHLNKKSGSKFS